MSSFKIISGIGILAVLFGILSSFFTVDQTQQALVLQFGEPKRLVNKPGLNFKIPFIQVVTFFEKRVPSAGACSTFFPFALLQKIASISK